MSKKSITYCFCGDFEPSFGLYRWSPIYPIKITGVLVRINETTNVNITAGVYIDGEKDPLFKVSLPAHQQSEGTNELNFPVELNRRIRIDVLDGKGKDLSVTLFYEF